MEKNSFNEIIKKLKEKFDFYYQNFDSEILNEFLYLRFNLYFNDRDYIQNKIDIITNNNKINKNENITKIIEKFNNFKNIKKENFLIFQNNLISNKIDLFFNYIDFKNIKNYNISLSTIENISNIIDQSIINSKLFPFNYSLIFPSKFINSNNINSLNNINTNFNEINTEIPIFIIRFFWTLLKYINNCLKNVLFLIKPIDKNFNEFKHVQITTISNFLSKFKNIMFEFIKIDMINEVINNTEYNEDQIQLPEIKIDRLQIANQLEIKKNQKNLTINNNNNNELEEEEKKIEFSENDSIFLHTFSLFKQYDIANFRSKKFVEYPKVAFKVTYINEFVEGIGGPYRQFFTDISNELKNYLPLLIPLKNVYTINPNFNNEINSLELFEFLGILFGICIRTNVHMSLNLTSLVWKKIIGEKINENDIKNFDEGLFNEIKLIKNYNSDESIILNYNTILSDGTNKNFNNNNINKFYLNKNTSLNEKNNYIQMLLNARLNESEKQINSIKKGISLILPLSLIKLLSYKQIEKLINGNKTIDINLLKKNTVFSNDLNINSKKVIWLFEILDEFSEEDKIKFIKFCYAQESIPNSQEDFDKNQIKFTIKNSKEIKRKNGFPKADTCFFNIELPDYNSKEIMKSKIYTAINLDNDSINADKAIGGNINVDNDRNNDYDNYDNNNDDDYNDNYVDNEEYNENEEFV